MEDQLSAAGCGVNVLGEAFEANPPLFKPGHGSYEMGKGAPQAV